MENKEQAGIQNVMSKIRLSSKKVQLLSTVSVNVGKGKIRIMSGASND